jgi:hypothetical protein
LRCVRAQDHIYRTRPDQPPDPQNKVAARKTQTFISGTTIIAGLNRKRLPAGIGAHNLPLCKLGHPMHASHSWGLLVSETLVLWVAKYASKTTLYIMRVMLPTLRVIRSAGFVRRSTAPHYPRRTNPGPGVLSSCSPRGIFRSTCPGPTRAALQRASLFANLPDYSIMFLFSSFFVSQFFFQTP